MSQEYQLTFNDYLSIIRRRAVLLGATFFGLLVIALVIAVAIPPVYQSSGTIMVESQQIPTDLIPKMTTSLVEERIEVIRQRVMTRETLVKIIDKYRLFEDSSKSLTVTEKIDAMRKQISIEPIYANPNKSSRLQGTIAFRLTFEQRHAELAHKGANELVTLFLDENVKARTERATETTEFLTQEASKLKVELEALENQLATYKQGHGNSLPEHQQLRMNMVSRTESELKDVEREYKTAQEELRFLDLELSAAKAGLTPRTGTPYAKPNEDLGSLKAEYARISAIYTAAHPDVRTLKRKIDALEAAAPAKAGDKAGGEAVNLDVAKVQIKISATQSRIESLAAQMKALRGKLAATEQQIIRSPLVEQGLVTLMRDHENARKKYEEISAKQMSAKITENLEGQNKAERFTLLEPPIFPEKPFKPDRIKIILIGFFLAIGGAGGLVFLLEALNQPIRGEEALAIAIRQRPMLVIPYITIESEIASRKRRIWKSASGLTVAIVLSLILVHFVYMPLDILMMKIISRFG